MAKLGANPVPQVTPPPKQPLICPSCGAQGRLTLIVSYGHGQCFKCMTTFNVLPGISQKYGNSMLDRKNVTVEQLLSKSLEIDE